MQKKHLLLALAATAVTASAMAQSSVTLYGRVNTTVEYQKTGDDKIYGLFNNSSRFGIKGVEDLGGGLKAGFQLESGFNSDTGMGAGANGGMSFDCQSEINLSGGFGMVRLGNFFPESYFATADYVSLHNHDTGSSSDALYYDPVWFGKLGTGNKVAYRTPDFGGFTAEAAMSFHEKASGQNGKHGYDLAANYAVGPLALGAGYSYVDGDYQLGLRGLYTMGQFTAGAYYQRNKQADHNGVTGWGTRNNFRISGMYALGASEFHINVGNANKWSNLPDSGATQWTLGYNYNLSKRTKVYSYYTAINNKDGANYGVGKLGDDFSSLAVGVRHNF